MVMSRRERKAQLVLRGIKLRDIAEQLDVTPQHICHVLAGRVRSTRVEQTIADAIGKPVRRVFPERVKVA